MSSMEGEPLKADEQEGRQRHRSTAIDLRNIKSVLAGHLAWAATLLLVFFVATRILLVAKLNVTTAAALVAASNTVTIATVVLISAIPVIISTAALILSFLVLTLDREARRNWIPIAVLGQLLLLVAAVLAAPPFGMILTTFILVGTIFAHIRLERIANRPTVSEAEERYKPIRTERDELEREQARLKADLKAAESDLDMAWRKQNELEEANSVDRPSDELAQARSEYSAAMAHYANLGEQLSELIQKMQASIRKSDDFLEYAEEQIDRYSVLADVHAKRAWRWSWIAAIGFALAPISNVFTSVPWVPAERIEIRAEAPVNGYVLKDSDFFTILTEDARQIRIVPKEKVTNRTVCIPRSLRAPGPGWLVRIFVRNPDAGYETC